MSDTDFIDLGRGSLHSAIGSMRAFGSQAGPFTSRGAWLITSWRLLGAGARR
jgi:hypothetical protein